jgi:uracil-DNA glycosylase family 4
MTQHPPDELADLAALLASEVAAWRSLGARSVAATPPAPAPVNALTTVQQEVVGDCTRCPLARSRRQLVLGSGPVGAAVAVVGGVPRDEEDGTGAPWGGEAGVMLDRMLENVLGLPRAQVFLLHAVMCRPPDDRSPAASELEACAPLVRAQLAAADPRVALVMGERAMRAVLGLSGIKERRGRWHELDGLHVMPTYSPRFLMRQPRFKRDVFDDLKLVKARLSQP